MSESDRQSVSYGNFQNPFGLVYRMLRSGNRAAYSALFREALGIAAKPIDALLSSKEQKHVAGSEGNKIPIVLVVGPPRSGTTLVYQVLSYCLDVTFPNNFSGLFPASPITVNGLAGRRRPDFQSFYGQTSRMSGPNDAFHIWNRWLGSDRYVTRTDLSAEEINEMQRFFLAWTSKYGKPFLNKNNRNVQCIEYLAEHLPNTYFIGIRRNPACVARSLVHARQAVQGDKTIGWGLQCQEQHCHKDSLGYVQDVCDQVKRNDHDLASSLQAVPAERVIQLQYESFCTETDRCIEQIVAGIPGLERRPAAGDFGKEKFRVSKSTPLSDAEENVITDNFSDRNA